MNAPMSGTVVAVCRSAVHGFSKQVVDAVEIESGLGVKGDAHAGATVRHLYRVRKNPIAPNLCQVHLLQSELFPELMEKGFALAPGLLGENVTTAELDLLSLPVGALVHLGASAVVEVTGLREPCVQMNRLQPGLMKACLARDAEGALLRKAGIMGIAKAGGTVREGDSITLELPPKPWTRMGPV